MGGARILVELTPVAGDAGEVAIDGARLSADGLERAEFLIAPNRGEEARSLHRVASGGELSRAMLAIKCVLADLGLPRNVLALALVGFNLGVEAGQIALVSVFLPVAYLLRRSWLYRNIVLAGGSSAIVVVAALWFVERAFDLNFLPIH
jgi:hypothetical protein